MALEGVMRSRREDTSSPSEDAESRKDGREAEKRLHCGACDNRRAVVDDKEGRGMIAGYILFLRV